MKEKDIGFNHIISCRDEIVSDINEQCNYLFFIKKGKVRIDYNRQQRIFDSGEMFFVSEKLTSIITLLNNSDVVVYSFQNKFSLCTIFDYEQLGEEQVKDIPTLLALKMTKPILSFLDLIILYIEDCLFCNYLLKIKEQELFILLKAFYAKQQLLFLFYPAFSMNIDVSES